MQSRLKTACVCLVFLFFSFVFESGVQSCRHGEWKEFEGNCYLFKHELFTFFEAKVTCDVLNSHLAVINGEDANTFISNMTRNLGGSYTWIGLEDLETEGHFVWYPINEMAEYTSWLPSDPNDFNHNEDCVTTRPDGKWQDWDCETKHSFVCQAPVSDEEVIG